VYARPPGNVKQAVWSNWPRHGDIQIIMLFAPH